MEILDKDEERVPFQATQGSKAYDWIQRLPVTVVLDNLRSAFNVGSFFRTADATRVERLLLSGITSAPPHKGVLKTSLGAEDTVPWTTAAEPRDSLLQLRSSGYQLVAIETSPHAVDLFDWVPAFPLAVVFGNEVDGISPPLAAACDLQVQLPMLGMKYSLNVATAGGIVMYELLRKYRKLRSGCR